MNRLESAKKRAGRRVSLVLPILFSALFACGHVFAFDLEFNIQPRLVRVGEAATCTLVIHGLDNPTTPQLPPIDGLQIGGPSRSSSSSMQIINGQMTRDSSITFQYSILPLRAGDFTIGPFKYSAEGQTVDLPAVQLRVVDPQSSASAPGQTAQQQPNLLARLSVSPTNLYNQQVFDLQVSIFYRGLNLGREINLLGLPSAGFTLEPFQELGTSREQLGNEVYEVRRFRSKARALTAGTFTLQPTVRVSVLTQRSRSRRRGLFDDPFFDIFGGVESQAVNIQPDPVPVTIKPLPADQRPSNFSGAVGQFTFEMQAKPTELAVGDPITISMLVAGQGNVDAVTTPELIELEGFKVYDARLVSQDSNRKLFEQVILPKTDQVGAIPPVSFSYFDPVSETYKTVTRGPIPLVLHAAPNGGAQLTGGAQTFGQKRAEVLGSDIIYLKPLPEEWIPVSDARWFQSNSFKAVQVLPVLAFLATVILVRRRDEMERNVAKARRLKAPRSARAGLQKSESAIRAMDRSAYYEGIWQAMSSYFGNRLNLPPGAIVPNEVVNALSEAGLEKDQLELVETLFRQCEEARFASAHDAGTAMDSVQARDTLNRLRRAFKACERIRIRGIRTLSDRTQHTYGAEKRD